MSNLAFLVALGVVITGVIGLGAYSLYNSLYENRTIKSMSHHPINNKGIFQSNVRRHPLFAGLPLAVQSLLALVSRTAVGGVLSQSLGRIRAIQSIANDKLSEHPRITQIFETSEIRVGSPLQVTEQTVNGAGTIRVVFPIDGHNAHVRVEASMEQNRLSYHQLLCTLFPSFSGLMKNHKYTTCVVIHETTGESIDLLRPPSGGVTRHIILDAEYKDL